MGFSVFAENTFKISAVSEAEAGFCWCNFIPAPSNKRREWLVFSVLCGYKLQECVHNHGSGLNVCKGNKRHDEDNF